METPQESTPKSILIICGALVIGVAIYGFLWSEQKRTEETALLNQNQNVVPETVDQARMDDETQWKVMEFMTSEFGIQFKFPRYSSKIDFYPPNESGNWTMGFYYGDVSASLSTPGITETSSVICPFDLGIEDMKLREKFKLSNGQLVNICDTTANPYDNSQRFAAYVRANNQVFEVAVVGDAGNDLINLGVMKQILSNLKF